MFRDGVLALMAGRGGRHPRSDGPRDCSGEKPSSINCFERPASTSARSSGWRIDGQAATSRASDSATSILSMPLTSTSSARRCSTSGSASRGPNAARLSWKRAFPATRATPATAKIESFSEAPLGKSEAAGSLPADSGPTSGPKVWEQLCGSVRRSDPGEDTPQDALEFDAHGEHEAWLGRVLPRCAPSLFPALVLTCGPSVRCRELPAERLSRAVEDGVGQRDGERA